MNSLNLFLYISWVTFLVNILTLGSVLYSSKRNLTNLLFSLFLTSMTIITFVGSISVVVRNESLFLLLQTISNTTLVFMPVLYLLFALAYSQKTAIFKNYFFVVSVLVGTALMVYLTTSTNLFLVRDMGQATVGTYGYTLNTGELYLLYRLWIQGQFLAAVFLLVQKLRRTNSKPQRKQVSLILAALLIQFIGNAIFYFILPQLGVTISWLSVLMTSIQALIVGYAILRYDLFALNTQLISNDVIETIPEALLVIDNHNLIKYVNLSTFELTGYSEKEILGQPLEKILPNPEETKRLLASLKATKENGSYFSVETEILKKDNHKVAVIMNYSPVRNRESGGDGIILLTDVTDLQRKQKEMSRLLDEARRLDEELKNEKTGVENKVRERTRQLDEARIKLQASIDSLNLGFIITDTQSNLVTINGPAKHLLCTAPRTHHPFGFFNNPDELNKSCTLDDIEELLKKTFDLRAQVLQSVKEKRPFDFKEVPFLGLFLHIYINPIVVPSNNFEVIGCVVLVEDVTEERVLARSRDEFFSIASHELRTPLTAIRGNSSMIQKFYADSIKDPQLKEMVDDIHQSSVRLLELVNDFLDSSRLEQGRMAFKNELFEIETVITDVVKEFQVNSSRQKLYLRAEPAGEKLPQVFADKDKIKQVLINLIGNSLKFTETGGITVSSGVDMGYVKVLVTDTGHGIPEANQSLLFHKFQQAGSSILTRDVTRGTGLGLYISKLMINGMGGKIKLEKSVINEGTTFSFTIPTEEHMPIVEETTKVTSEIQK